MRICYVGSTGVHTVRWMKYFAGESDVHLVTSEESPAPVPGIKVHTLKRRGPRQRLWNFLINGLPMALQFRRYVRQIKPDILHAHYISETALLGAASGFRQFVLTVWGSDVLIEPRRSRLSRWIARYVISKAELITCDAEHMKKPLIELGAAPEKIRIIFFGTDTRKFCPGDPDGKLAQELGITSSPVIISLRRLEPVYDIATLVKAMPLVLGEAPAAKLLLVGGGSQETELKRLAESLGIGQSVRFAGPLPADELPRYLRLADVYVSTSLSDAGLAASTAEAMACELPVVVTDFGDNGQWVKDGVNGFTIPLRDPEALARRLTSLLKDPAMRQRFGQAGRQIIEERNSWQREMGKVDGLYRELIERHTRAGVLARERAA